MEDKQRKILVLGSSHIRRLDSYLRSNQQFGDLDLTNCKVEFFGVSGGTLSSAHCRTFEQAIQTVASDVLIVQLGGNNLDASDWDPAVGSTTGEEVAIRLVNGVKLWRARLHVPVAVVCQLMPRGSTRHIPPTKYNKLVIHTNQCIKAECRGQLLYWNLKGLKNPQDQIWLDGVHLNFDLGYYKYFRNIRGVAIAGLSRLRH